MIYINILFFVFQFITLSFDIKAFLPAPEMDVQDVLVARHFSEFTYKYAQERHLNGIHVEPEYMGQRWFSYPFRLNGCGQETPHAGAVFRNGEKLIVAFRGSATVFDWWKDITRSHKRDATCIRLSGYVHTGFSEILELLTQSLENVLFQACQDAGSPCEYIFTGHSLGGALSTLAAGSFAAAQYQNFLENQIKVVNFSSPNVGDSTLSEHIEMLIQKHNILSFANEADLVPYLPPTAFDWYSTTGLQVSIRTEEHILGILTNYIQNFYPWNLNILEIGMIYSLKDEVNSFTGKSLPYIAVKVLMKMHVVPEERVIERNFREMKSRARCSENYEDLFN